jgi:hypothetical protein
VNPREVQRNFTRVKEVICPSHDSGLQLADCVAYVRSRYDE